jgi:YkoY family integral membrane protein
MSLVLQDLVLIIFLAFLEGILSVDNALVLALMAKPLPAPLQRKALTYGLLGSVVFRLLALALAKQLIHWHWAKLAGGAYLLYVAVSHLIKRGQSVQDTTKTHAKPHGFWRTVLMIELMDIAFAVDSILAAVALSPKFWVVFAGGMMGVILMRFAASLFLKMLTRFPGFETSAYLLVLVIGLKLCVDWLDLPGVEFESPHSPAFWAFWGAMAVCAASGFRKKRTAV